MAATPSNNRLKLTPSNSPYLSRPSRSPLRGRAIQNDSKLLLKRVIGTTCSSPTGFDSVKSSFAYIAGGAVVVVDVNGQGYSQRFFRARPTAVPIYTAATFQNTPTTPTGTPRANDSRGRVALRDSPHGGDWAADSPGASKTWTSRERIKAATCLALSRDGKYLAVGETGYAPRVLIFNLQDASSDTPLVSITEHAFGVRAVAWSADSRWLASLGAANDGFLYVWRIDPRTGAARLFQQNRCTSYIKDMIWLGNSLITLGVRHVKMWKIEETQSTSPTKLKFLNDSIYAPPSQKTLPGRNVLLGGLIDATFTCAAVKGKSIILCTEAGDICIFDDDDKQMKLLRVLNLAFEISSITIRGNAVYVGGKEGQFVTLDFEGVMNAQESTIVTTTQTSDGVIAMGFLADRLVTIDGGRSINIWSADHVPGNKAVDGTHVPIPGHGETIVGIQPLPKPNRMDASFYTWSAAGAVSFWDLDGRIKLSMDVPIDMSASDPDYGPVNQLTCARVSKYGKYLVTADRQGVLKVTDTNSGDCLLDIKAHSADCICISLYEDDSKFIMASCGRDRTTQLFHRNSQGLFEHFQTIDFNAKVVQVLIPSDDRILACSMDRTMQVHEILSKEDEPDAIAAIPTRVITLKASPTSMTMALDGRTVFVSMLDRSISQFDIETSRQINCFKCIDEGGSDSAILDSLSIGNWAPKDQDFLLGTSNTDKSIRLYDANSGSFLEREWGHTESITGVCLLEDDDGSRKVVSVGSDGTTMIWALDLNDPSPRSMSRDPSPAKDGTPTTRPTLRRVLSKAELAEFQRPSPSSRQTSPPRTLRRRTSRTTLSAALKTPTTAIQASPNGPIAEDTPSRRPSGDSRAYSPPSSPRGKVTRRPSLPALGVSARKKSSNPNLRGFGTLNMSTEQACRTLRAYRKKLSSAEPISAEVLTELDQELRLTAAALGERAIRSKAMNETVLSGLLDEYSERLVTLLDEKLRLTSQPRDQGDQSSNEAQSPNPDRDSGESSPSS